MSLSQITNNPHLWTAKIEHEGTEPGAIRASSNPSGAAHSGFWSRLWSPLFASNKQDSSCYDRLNAKYPNMDADSRSIVRILCDNQQTGLNTGELIHVSDQGIEAVGEALQQNTALQSFDWNTVYCIDPDTDCVSTLANALASALKVNRALQELTVDLSTSSLATQTFLHNLPCFNLNSLSIKTATTSEGAQDFSNTMQSNPYFPLRNLTWYERGSSGSALPQVAVALGNTRCIDTLTIWGFGFDDAEFTNMYQVAIGNSKIANANIAVDNPYPAPYIPLTPAQEQAILSGIENNACFLNYIQYCPCGPLPPDFAAKIQNLLQGRTPCLPDPQCLVPVSCATPPNPAPPDSSSGLSNAATIAIAVTVTAIGALALGWLANHVYQKCKRPSTPLAQQLV